MPNEVTPPEPTIIIEDTPPQSDLTPKFEDYYGMLINYQAKYYVGYDTVPASGNTLVVTGVGFTPKMIKFTATATGDGQARCSIGHTDGTTQNVIYWWESDSNIINNDSVIYVFDGVNSTRAHIHTLNGDGFTIHCPNNSFEVKFMFECYG